MIKVDETRLVTEEEYGYYWTWGDDNRLRVYFKEEGCYFYEGSVYSRLQETPPEKPRVLADGWYLMVGKCSGKKSILEKRGAGVFSLNAMYYGSIHLFDVVSGPVDFGKVVKND